MKKSTLLVILAGVMVAFAGSGFAAWNYTNQAELAAQQTEQLAKEQEAIRQETERLQKEREAARQEAKRLEKEREQQRQEEARLRQQELLVTQTANAWRKLNIVLDNADSALTNNSSTPVQVMAYIANQLAGTSTTQIDADLASLIEDFRSTATDANQVIVSYDNRIKQLNAGYSEAAQVGCDIGRASVQGERPGHWDCLIGGFLSYVVVEAGTNEEVEQLQANLHFQLDALGKQWNVLDERKEAMGAYLYNNYDISLP